MVNSASVGEKRHRYLAPIIVCLVFASPSAHANSGTPLVLATFFHLLIGNTIIGILEGILLAACFRARALKAIAVMIPANYFSSFVGLSAINGVGTLLSFDITNVIQGILCVILFTYLMTLFLEAPFVALIFWRAEHRGRKIVFGSLVAQTSSYVLLFGLYWLASDTSLCTANRVVPLSAMSIEKSVTIYYIDPADGGVYKTNLAVPKRQSVSALRASGLDDRLIVQQSKSTPGQWDLAARLETADPDKPKVVIVAESFASNTAPSWMAVEYGEEPGTSNNADGAAQLPGTTSSDLTFSGGLGAAEGLSVWRNSAKKEEMRFAFQVPGLSWNVRNLTHLPSDKVLFQLGANQICLFDPSTRQLALVARGRGPVAVLEPR